jgi:hypothetical protein
MLLAAKIFRRPELNEWKQSSKWNVPVYLICGALSLISGTVACVLDQRGFFADGREIMVVYVIDYLLFILLAMLRPRSSKTSR